MRILYLSQYAPPEVGATSARAHEMASGLIRAGHQVTMLTEMPSHPEGIIRPEYRGRFWMREAQAGIDTIRVWVNASPVKTTSRRMAFYLSYMVNATLAGMLLARGTYDLLYATSPPLFVGGTALALSVMRRIPLVFEVRDLWPESAVALGELRNDRLVRLATWLEEACYHRASLVVVTAQEILDRLIQRGQPPEKLALVRNGANVDLFRHDEAARRRIRAALGFEKRFVALYAGLFGLAYDLELVLEAARDLETRAPDVQFLLVGEGPTRRRIEALAATIALKNVTFLPPVSRKCIPDYFSAADISLVPMREPNIRGMLPVKIYDSMACEVPVIVSSTGEARSIVEETGSGLAILPGDRDQLRDAILLMRNSSDLRRHCALSGRQAVVANYSREAQAQRLVGLLEALWATSNTAADRVRGTVLDATVRARKTKRKE